MRGTKGLVKFDREFRYTGYTVNNLNNPRSVGIFWRKEPSSEDSRVGRQPNLAGRCLSAAKIVAVIPLPLVVVEYAVFSGRLGDVPSLTPLR